MLDSLLLLALIAIGTAALWLAALACYHGGAWLSRLLWWLFFERLER